MLKNRKSGGTCCVGGLAVVEGFTAVGGLTHSTFYFSIFRGLAAPPTKPTRIKVRKKVRPYSQPFPEKTYMKRDLMNNHFRGPKKSEPL